MYKLNKGFIVQKIDKKQTIVFDGESSMLYTFNETASVIFQQLKKGKTLKEIVKVICCQYKVTLMRAENDVRLIVSDFLKRKIFVAKRPTKPKIVLKVGKKHKASSKKVVAKPKRSK